MIVERAAGLFNSLGYYRASLSDVMNATGLEKGGIYNHFASKDELAVASFEFSVKAHGSVIKKAVDSADDPMDKLNAFVDGFRSLVRNPPIPGGCPLLNCATENDDGNQVLAEKVRLAMESLLNFAEILVQNAQQKRQLASKYDSRQIATFLVSSLEGGVMLTRLYNDPNRMEFVAQSLKNYLCDLKN